MTDLERYRDEIDEIDSEIVRLFEKRMKVSEEVAEYKIKTGKQVLDPARESQKIHTLKNKAHGDFNSLGVQELFRQIMAISRKRQYQLLTEHGIYGKRNGCVPGCRGSLQLCGYAAVLWEKYRKLPCKNMEDSYGGCNPWQGRLCGTSY